MAHYQQQEFCLKVKKKLEKYFFRSFVLDIGSLDINGNNQYLFDESGYIGVDLSVGRNVDVVTKGHEVCFPDETFDVILSTECFEHDQHYTETIRNCYRMLKKGGLFLFTCATTGRPEHGTRRSMPADAPFIQNIDGWSDYYKNLTEKDIRDVIDPDGNFSQYEFSSNLESFDLYFYGIKNGEHIKRNNYSFIVKERPIPMYASCFTDAGDGFSDKNMKMSAVEYFGRNTAVFNFDDSENLKALRFHVSDKNCIAEIESIEIETPEGVISCAGRMFHNAFHVDNNVYYFDNDAPHIYFDAHDICALKKLTVVFEYIATGKEAHNISADVRNALLQKELDEKNRELAEQADHIASLKQRTLDGIIKKTFPFLSK